MHLAGTHKNPYKMDLADTQKTYKIHLVDTHKNI